MDMVVLSKILWQSIGIASTSPRDCSFQRVVMSKINEEIMSLDLSLKRSSTFSNLSCFAPPLTEVVSSGFGSLGFKRNPTLLAFDAIVFGANVSKSSLDLVHTSGPNPAMKRRYGIKACQRILLPLKYGPGHGYLCRWWPSSSIPSCPFRLRIRRRECMRLEEPTFVHLFVKVFDVGFLCHLRNVRCHLRNVVFRCHLLNVSLRRHVGCDVLERTHNGGHANSLLDWRSW